MNQNAKTRMIVNVWIGVLAIVLFAAAASACASLGRTALVGGGAGVGAAVGSIAGPAGAVGGAVVGGAVTHSVVETDAAAKRSDKLENKILQSGGGAPPPSGPMGFLGIAWWWWAIAAYFLFLRRAHLKDLLLQKGGRVNAALRTVGIRTSHTQTK